MESLGVNVTFFIAQIINLTVVIILAYIAYRVISRIFRRSSGRPRALEILDQRLANGEIGTDEYHELKATLTDATEKPKRDVVLRLSDDGELIEDNLETAEKRKN